MRPIVTSIGSALYNPSKFLADIISPIQNNGFAVRNSIQYAKEINDIAIADDEVMVSFDVVSLFTAVPVQKACDYILKKLEGDNTLSSRTNLDIDDIISLLSYILCNNYFIFEGNTYKQIHGCAMGSPVTPVVANICMESIEEMAIKQTPVRPKVWKHFVDDSFSIINKNAISTFHDALNSIEPKIQFTIEYENNEKLAFVDTIISRPNKKLCIDVYRKPTHTDRYLDYNSHHDRKHKANTARTLIHRALTLPNTEEGKTNELKHVTDALRTNGYPMTTINNTINNIQSSSTAPSPEELVGMFFRSVDPPETTKQLNYATLPYVKGITESLTTTLRKYGISVTTKPLQTLQQHFPSLKHKVESDKQTNVVNKILCADCSWSYIGETGRSFETRKKKHVRNVTNYTTGSNIANHAWKYDHEIDFDKRKIIDRGNFRIRKTVESWHTAATKDTENNAKPLAKQYTTLIKKHCRC